MTKPIIINGVDVSECEYYDSKMNGVCECKNTKEYGTPTRITGCGGCKFNPDCYYKQLTRKEQECEKYKNTLNKVKELLDFECEKYNKCSHAQMCICNVCDLYDDVLEIINDVENDRANNK